MTNKRTASIWISVILITTLAAGITACAGPGSDTPGVTDDEIVIGTWGPLTGPAALWGGVIRGMEAYFQLINEEGGIHGRQIRLVYRDDGYEPPRTVSAVRQMVQNDEVFLFVGGIGTAPGMAVRNFIIDNNIPWISPATGSTHFGYPPRENIFSMYPLYVDDAALQVDYAVNDLGASRIAIIYQNDDYGKGGLTGAEMALEEMGMQLVAKVSTEIMDSDLSSHAARLRESGAEVVLLWVLPRQAAIIMGTTAVLGYRPQWIASSTLSDFELMYDITDGAWEGVIFSNFGLSPTSDHPLVNKYREALHRFSPENRFSAFTQSGFLFAEPVVEALRMAGRDLTREKLIEAMESLDGFQGIGPEISFAPGQRQGSRSLKLERVVGPREVEVLTDFRTSGIDVEKAIERMGL
ncbi:MAG: ABC transporter substrate-binding protein [Balneolaceae bacterium]|nr:MAG: ABC transporter substrate-binding protein [Balneolaceae bacterium]